MRTFPLPDTPRSFRKPNVSRPKSAKRWLPLIVLTKTASVGRVSRTQTAGRFDGASNAARVSAGGAGMPPRPVACTRQSARQEESVLTVGPFR